MKPFKPAWNSLSQHAMPQWLREAKFGIYTTWGIFSVPAYAGIDHWKRNPNVTWYGHDMYEKNHPVYRRHLKVHGESKTFGYKDFIPQFKGEKFDAEEWAQLFKEAGAKFAGPIAVFHDNFAMYNSKVNPWNAAAMGPKRDVTGELEKAIRGQGMKFIATFHHAYNWWFFPKSEEFDTVDPSASGLYSRQPVAGALPDEKYLKDWYDQIIEVIDGYDPDLIWFDFCLGRIPERYRKNFLAYYYNKAQDTGKEVIAAFKRSGGEGFRDFNLSPLAGLLDLEMGRMNELTPHAWLTDTCIDANPMGCWGHARSIGYKSPERLIHNLVDMVSKNGYLLLNVGPRADGTIPQPAQDILREIGKWLAINGEAIYGTVPWHIDGEGPTKVAGGGDFNERNEVRFNCHDIRYTCKDDAVYATALGRPGEILTCTRFAHCQQLHPSDILSIRMLGGDGRDLEWSITEDGLNIGVPDKVPSNIAVSFKITTKSAI